MRQRHRLVFTDRPVLRRRTRHNLNLLSSLEKSSQLCSHLGDVSFSLASDNETVLAVSKFRRELSAPKLQVIVIAILRQITKFKLELLLIVVYDVVG